MKNTKEPIVLQVGVKVFLRNRAGKYLLLRRSLVKYPEIKGRWDIVGGRIDAGTALLKNLQREVKEETGLKITGTPKLLFAQDILRIPGRHVVRLTYVGKTTGKPVIDPEEHDMFAWYTLKELQKLSDLDIYLREPLKSGLLT